MISRLPIEVRPRQRATALLQVVATLSSVGIALVLGAVLLFVAGVHPLSAYRAIFSASLLGGPFALSDTTVKATPLLLCGLGCAVAFRAKLWNVGAEGQLLLGAWAATGMASFWLPQDLPAPLLLGLMAIAAVLAGAAWGAIAGVLRAYFGVNEIISTLMLVYVAQKLLNYFIFGAWSEGGFPLTPTLPPNAWLPRLSDLAAFHAGFTGLTAHLGILVGLVLCFALWFVLKRTVWGFELRLLGDSPKAARYIGLSVERKMLATLVLSGALAGLAGMIEVAGVVHRLQDRFSPGYGFVAIAVAWLGRLNPWGILLGALLFGALLVGAKEIQPYGIAMMLQGVILLVAVAGDFLVRYEVRLRRGPTKDPPLGDESANASSEPS
jgi:general nucleoside transport system permease protein